MADQGFQIVAKRRYHRKKIKEEEKGKKQQNQNADGKDHGNRRTVREKKMLHPGGKEEKKDQNPAGGSLLPILPEAPEKKPDSRNFFIFMHFQYSVIKRSESCAGGNDWKAADHKAKIKQHKRADFVQDTAQKAVVAEKVHEKISLTL